jgi:hypothetical protein
VWWYILIILVTQDTEAGRLWVQSQPGKVNKILPQRQIKQQKGIAQMTENLCSKHKAMVHFPSPAKKLKKKKKNYDICNHKKRTKISCGDCVHIIKNDRKEIWLILKYFIFQ